jgi:PAS domain-containing protein
MIVINRNKLKAAARFAAHDAKDRREALHGVLVEASPAGVRLVATDGHVLLVQRAAGTLTRTPGRASYRRTPSRRRWRGRATRPCLSG